MTRVFVYGTLKRGGSNHPCLAGQKYLGEARTVPGYTLYSLGEYPGMVRVADPAKFVRGELWEVDDAGLAVLDELEGVAKGLYERVFIDLAPPCPAPPVATYLYLHDLTGKPELGSTWNG